MVSPESAISSDYMDIARLFFSLSRQGAPKSQDAKDKLLAHIKEKEMAPFYSTVCEQLGWEADATWLAAMKESNAAEAAKLAEKLADAEQNEGESEIAAALLARAEFLTRIGEKTDALSAYDDALAKTVALGPKLDVMLAKLRIGLFFEDLKLVTSTIDKAKALLEEGGDWERRNRLKVYEALFLIRVRSFKKAAALLLDSIATFTATELLSYTQFVMYTVLTSLISLPRAQLKEKIVDAPEILQVIGEIPYLADLLNGMYSCKYATLMRALVEVVDGAIVTDRYMYPHARYYWRETRVLAYSQFLESYRSVSLASMANTFGVSGDFLDDELSGFIAAERLSCKIDKVSGVVSSTRPDSKNAQYQAVIKEGDQLLNRLQKLSRVFNL